MISYVGSVKRGGGRADFVGRLPHYPAPLPLQALERHSRRAQAESALGSILGRAAGAGARARGGGRGGAGAGAAWREFQAVEGLLRDYGAIVDAPSLPPGASGGEGAAEAATEEEAAEEVEEAAAAPSPRADRVPPIDAVALAGAIFAALDTDDSGAIEVRGCALSPLPLH